MSPSFRYCIGGFSHIEKGLRPPVLLPHFPPKSSPIIPTNLPNILLLNLPLKNLREEICREKLPAGVVRRGQEPDLIGARGAQVIRGESPPPLLGPSPPT